MLAFLTLLLGCPNSNETDTEPPGPTVLVCEGDDGGTVEMLVAPFLQSVGTDSAWVVWETDEGIGSRVEWGLTQDLGEAVCGDRVPVIAGGDPNDAESDVHEAQLTGLSPDTTYMYQVRTGQTQSAVLHFRTPPTADAEASFRMIAMSDSQLDDNNPDEYDEVVQDGVVAYVREQFGEDLADELGFVLFPGDLVDNGWAIDEWREDWFAPSAELFSAVPVYPAIGNHEGGSPHYFRYFHLPEATEALGEHAYSFDRSNVRVIALDSNGYAQGAQLDWLAGVLSDTCAADEIDFVFAQIHHPWKSELWTPGESTFTGDVVAQLEAWSTECGKPSIHFFGHTHGYSRGQTRDHQHVMVNVASAGGALDPWGSDDNQDYDEFTVSQSTWGFVIAEVEAGDAPKFSFKRISRGNAADPAVHREDDALTVWRYNDKPDKPTAVSACGADPLILVASDFSDSAHAHQASHWQVAGTDCDFSTLVDEHWDQRHNIYEGVDQASAIVLNTRIIEAADPGCWRVRYRDEGLVWSDWSDGSAIDGAGCP